jgi:predicted nucleic acid-binding Zn finger protein
MVEWGSHHGGYGGFGPPSYIVKKCPGNRGLKIGHFRYTIIVAHRGNSRHMALKENYCTSHYFCFILKHGHICRSFLSLTAAFKLNTLYFTIIFIEFEFENGI